LNSIPGPSVVSGPSTTSTGQTRKAYTSKIHSLFDDIPYMQLSDDLTDVAQNPWDSEH
jgi:hypothetical protein